MVALLARIGGQQVARPVLGIVGLTREGNDLALAQMLFENLRDRILDGVWRHGEKLPGSRVIAKDAGVSRWTAVMAVEMLIAEGLVEARKRSGTYVNWPGDSAPKLDTAKSTDQSDAPKPHVPFAVGAPGLDLFPMQVWRRIQAKRWRDMPLDALQTGFEGGWPDLRAAIATHVGATRGLRCSPEQVIVATGTHAALLVATEVLGRPGRPAWMEEPGYVRVGSVLKAAGLWPVAISIDAEGLDVEEGRRRAPTAAMAVVSSSFQFPTGVALSARRKQALIEWSQQVGSFIVEDDYECEFQRSRAGSVPLAAMPNAERVIYMNTFSTTIFPSLRLSYLIVPMDAVDRFSDTLRRTERYATVPNQIVLADFMNGGHFAKHVRRCRDAYAERGTVLAEALAEHCPGVFVGEPLVSGMHLCVRFARLVDDSAVAEAARNAGLTVEPLSQFYSERTADSGLVIGFAGFRPEAIRDAVQRLAGVLQQGMPAQALACSR
jgi:GntR family transcriptional regulator/MocR family aminotransferase